MTVLSPPLRNRECAARRAAVVTALIGIPALAGCSSSSSPTAPIVAPPSAQPSTLQPSAPPSDARDVQRPATVVVHAGAGDLHLRSAPGEPADIFVAPSGPVTFQLSAADGRGDVFSISGGAATGAPLTNERVALFDLGPGLYFDTTNPGQARCSTTFSVVTSTRLSGQTTCTDLADGPAQQVTATFTVG